MDKNAAQVERLDALPWHLSKFVQIYIWIPVFMFNFNIEYDR